MGEHPLHRHAHLPGMVEASFDELRQGRLQVRIGGHQYGSRPAMLQRAANSWSQPGAQHPADGGAPNKAEEPHAPVGYRLCGNVRIFTIAGPTWWTIRLSG